MDGPKDVLSYLEETRVSLFAYDIDAVDEVIDQLEEKVIDGARVSANERGSSKPNRDDFQRGIEIVNEQGPIIKQFSSQLRHKRSMLLLWFLIFNTGFGIYLLFSALSLIYVNDHFSYYEKWYDLDLLRSATMGSLAVQFIAATVMLSMCYTCFRRPERMAIYALPIVSISLSLGFFNTVFLIPVIRDYFLFTHVPWHDHLMVYSIFFSVGFFMELIGLLKVMDRTGDLPKKSRLYTYGRSNEIRVISVGVFVGLMVITSICGATMNDKGHFQMEWKRLDATEYIGGEYDARIDYWTYYMDKDFQDRIIINYSYMGERIDGSFDTELRNVLDWMRTNTSNNSTFLSWWDYGHMIRAYANRDVVVDRPIPELEETIRFPEWIEQWDGDKSDLENVSRIMISHDDQEATSIMDQLGADHIIIHRRDAWSISYVFYYTLGLDDESMDWDEIPPQPSDFAEDSLVHRVWRDEKIDGLELIYSDINVKILKRS